MDCFQKSCAVVKLLSFRRCLIDETLNALTNCRLATAVVFINVIVTLSLRIKQMRPRRPSRSRRGPPKNKCRSRRRDVSVIKKIEEPIYIF